MLVQVSAALFQIQLPAKAPHACGKAVNDGPVLESLPPRRETGWSSWLLGSARPSLGFGSPMQSEPVDGNQSVLL